MSFTLDFIDIRDFSALELQEIISLGLKMKDEDNREHYASLLSGKVLAMIFEKPSTRTRVSFEVAMKQLGGDTIFLAKNDIQLGHGESISDTAKVLSRFVDVVMIRCNNHNSLVDFSANSDVPVINGLSDRSHPCQIMADLMTLCEIKGDLGKQKVTWVGDGNNVAVSWIEAAAILGIDFSLACPKELMPNNEILEWASNYNNIDVGNDPVAAVKGADCVIADTWVSMGDSNVGKRFNLLQPYQVNSGLMVHADDNAIFMHCLPAYRGKEVTADVIDGDKSVVFAEAENRLHAQRGILAYCMR